MQKIHKIQNYLYIFIIIVTAFTVNTIIASRGVFPIDTFVHYDSGYRILLGEYPVKDFWIVHGFLIDFIQSIFFKILGVNWFAYVSHASVFNVFIALFSYLIFKELKIDKTICFILSLLISFLAYPVSGTPFLDLHSNYFGLFAVYFAIFSIIKKSYTKWFYVSFFLCLSFFSKQVPSAYIILGVTIFNLFITIHKREIKFFYYYLAGSLFSLISLIIFLILLDVSLKQFILQLIQFPSSIGVNRYANYELGIKNLFLDFKFIHLFFFPIIFLNFYFIIKKKNYFNSNEFNIFILISIYTLSTLIHQIYTQNQIYIFSTVPILTGFLIFYLKGVFNFKNNYFLIIIIVSSTLITYKYHLRFNIDRKFHELNKTELNNAIDASSIDISLKGLQWISPYFKDPNKEIQIINNFIEMLKKDKKNKMVITEYNFISSILKKSVFTPSRTFDRISYPLKDTIYYDEYKNYLINIIKSNNIKSIYTFDKNEIDIKNINHRVFNYVSKNCFDVNRINAYVKKLDIKTCKDLN